MLAIAAGHVRLAVALLEVVEDLADAEEAHRDDDEVDAVRELRLSKVKRSALVKLSLPTVASSRPIAAAARALTVLPLPMVATSSTPSSASAAYSGGPKSSAKPATIGPSSVRPMIETVRADEGADRGDAEGGAGLALLGEGEAVEDGDHRAGLTGDAQQDRGDGAAVLGAVVDAGEHDDRRDRVVGAVGDRQQDGHRGGRAEAGQHADEHADDDADQAVEQVGRAGSRRAKPSRKALKSIGVSSRVRRRAGGAAGSTGRRGTARRTPRSWRPR